MAAEVAYLGIRHHGPGSARRVLARLEALQPGVVLIEGPADLSDALPALRHPQMRPPVALLAYGEKQPEQASFWPFAEYSPEYQAALWALAQGAEVRFIDLPVAQRFETPMLDADEDAVIEEAPRPDPDQPPVLHRQRGRDPFTELGRHAGFEDGESFWNDLFETSGEDAFDAIEAAVAALREGEVLTDFEARREAHMRLEIAKTAKDADTPVAVICGAWHVPALKAKHAAKDDRALLKGVKKEKIKSTWVPWTSPRLSAASGYGAGVLAPKWYEHLWRAGSRAEADASWAVQITRAMRDKGQVVSTASSIEVIRLARSLAHLRDRPRPGFEELREASVACLSFGELLPWAEIERELLLGSDVGAVPDDLPLAPLLEDLARQQKKTRMKPEALERELSLDLRSDIGLAKSTLLHRLSVLNVPWGQPADRGRSRGTFREKWVLKWEPEYAVELVEKLAYGTTIETACAARLAERLQAEDSLGRLADLTFDALTAQLPVAVAVGLKRLGDVAALTDDCTALLGAVPPLAETIRYGQARAVDTEAMAGIATQMATQGAIALPLAARGLDRDEAAGLFDLLPRVSRALDLGALGVGDHWAQALRDTALSEQTTPLVAGVATRLCFEADHLEADTVATRVARAISSGQAAGDAAGFFEGMFTGAGQQLIHDARLRRIVDDWLLGLDEDDYLANLPLMRRVFSAMDKVERRALFDRALGRDGGAATAQLRADADTRWAAHLPGLMSLLDMTPATLEPANKEPGDG